MVVVQKLSGIQNVGTVPLSIDNSHSEAVKQRSHRILRRGAVPMKLGAFTPLIGRDAAFCRKRRRRQSFLDLCGVLPHQANVNA